MSKPFHVIATPDENGYTVTIPENPNVSARCADAADIVQTATAAKEQDEQNRRETRIRVSRLFAVFLFRCKVVWARTCFEIFLDISDGGRSNVVESLACQKRLV